MTGKRREENKKQKKLYFFEKDSLTYCFNFEDESQKLIRKREKREEKIRKNLKIPFEKYTFLILFLF